MRNKLTRLLSVMIAAVMIIVMVPASIFADDFVLGDVTGDKQVTADDLTLLSRHVAKIEELTGDALAAADVNRDRQVDANDLTTMSRFVASIILSFDEEAVYSEEDLAVAAAVDELIAAIQVQQRTDTTDEDCAAAKAAWDALTDDQKELVEEADYFGRDTGNAALDDPRNTDDIGEKEILVVSFGTSFNDSRVADIKSVEDALAAAYPDWSVRRAFTAQIIINHVQARDGEKIDNVKQALDRAVKNGVKTLVVQPTHLMVGAEYNELVEELEKYTAKIEQIFVADPLLGPLGTKMVPLNADKEAAAKAAVAAAIEASSYETLAAAAADKTAIVFMGHGTSHEANATYTQMQQQMEKLEYNNVFIGTVEGLPASTACDVVIDAVAAAGYTKVILRPLMVVAGDHANNDMADEEDEESWISQFNASGKFTSVECQIAGLGRIAAIQAMYVAHTADAMPLEVLSYSGDKLAFLEKDLESTFGMWTPSNDTPAYLEGENVVIHIVPSSTRKTYTHMHWGSIHDLPRSKDVAVKDDGSIDLTLKAADYCGKAFPITPIKADGGTTSGQYYLAVPAADKLHTKKELEDLAAAAAVDELIATIQSQERTDTTDEDCTAAKAAWDALTDIQKELVEEADYFGRDTGDASADDPRNADDIGEKEILVVSFGTSFNDSRAADIKGVEDALAAAYPDWSVRRAFTAQIIINHVQARDNEKIDNVKQALDRAVKNGVKTLVVQPTHLMHGAEYNELVDELENYKTKIDKIVVAEPLLGTVGATATTTNADKKAVAEAAVAAAIAKSEYASLYAAEKAKTAIVFMGHGTSHEANVTYTQMQKQMKNLEYNNVFIGTVEGLPAETACDAVINAVAEAGYTKVILRPLMVVAGDHANNDMADEEDEESWVSQFKASGKFESVTCQIAGLGRIADIQKIYVEHTKKAMPLADGEYTIKFDPEYGSMFKANDGTGKLTVEGDKMTVYVVLSGTGFDRVYVGSKAEAKNASAGQLIAPEVVNVGGKDKNAYEIPIPYMYDAFTLATRSAKSGDWFEHTITISDPQPLN